MAAGVQPLTLLQVGKESSAGTAVAATRRLLTKSATYRHLETQELFEGQLSGVLSRSTTTPVITREATQLSVSTDLDFNSVLLPLLSGVKGGVTPTTPGTGEARLWTFAPSQTAPSVDAYTIEMVVDSGSAKQEIEAPFGVTTSFSITGGIDAIPQITWDMEARKSVQSTYTSGIATPAVVFGPNLRWSVQMDDTWANVGNTTISNQCYGFEWSQSPLIMPTYYLDGRDSLDFSTVESRTRTTDVTMQLTFDTGGSGFYETELAKKAAGTIRFLQLKLQGANFAAPDASRLHTILLKGCFVHADDSLQDLGADRDGNAVVSCHLISQYDPTGAVDFEVSVENKLTSFP